MRRNDPAVERGHAPTPERLRDTNSDETGAPEGVEAVRHLRRGGAPGAPGALRRAGGSRPAAARRVRPSARAAAITGSRSTGPRRPALVSPPIGLLRPRPDRKNSSSLPAAEDCNHQLERGGGFEPLLHAWKARVLPLHQPRGTGRSIPILGLNPLPEIYAMAYIEARGRPWQASWQHVLQRPAPSSVHPAREV